MATIADSFLADMDSDDEEEEKDQQQDGGHDDDDDDDDDDNAGDGLPEPTVNDIDFGDDGEEEKKEEKSNASVTGVTTLLTDNKLSAHIDLVDKLMQSTEEPETGVHRNVDREAEYPVIVKSNELAVDIDNEIFMIHKFIRDIYALKYAELEQLVPNPLDYAKVVKVIGNETDISKVEKQLADIIPQNTILTISVTATTTIGKPLSDDDLKKVQDACDGVLTLDTHKRKIFSYIESRMSFIAPNLSAIVGPDVAARLMGTAGGLTALSKIPSCNLQVLGVKRKTISGFSSARQDLHMGILTQVDVMLASPPALRQRTIRLLASKCVLAARIDSFFEDATGNKGREMREEVERKVRKWQEPPPPKKKRALPVPNDKPRKKRGGKKYRKFRERYMVTEVQKQKNRMLFGKAEVVDDYTGEGMGMLGQEGSGVLQVKNRDTQKLKDRLSKKTKVRLQRVKTPSVGGTASSMAFTPVQGIELVAAREAVRASDKYFSNTTTFFKVGSGTRTPAGDSSVPKLESGNGTPRGSGKKRPASDMTTSSSSSVASSSSSSSAAAKDKTRRVAPPVPAFK